MTFSYPAAESYDSLSQCQRRSGVALPAEVTRRRIEEAALSNQTSQSIECREGRWRKECSVIAGRGRAACLVLPMRVLILAMAMMTHFGCHCAETVVADSAPATLHVTVLGIAPGRGVIRCALYEDRATFLKPDGISEGFTIPASTERAEFELRAQSGRTVVVSVFQDLDSDKELGRGAMGIPNEPWGFSGHPSPIGPPSWSACAIVPTAGDNRLEIQLIGKAR